MFWMLMGGAILFSVIVAGVVVAMLKQGEGDSRVVSSPVAADVTLDEASVPVKSDTVILAEAEPVIREFLTATSVEAMLPLVRNPEVAEERMTKFYAREAIEAPGLAEFGGELTRAGSIMTVGVRTKDYENRQISFDDTPGGIGIDWESWAGWSEMPWGEFLTSKPVAAKLFRVKISEVDYYNFAFTDDQKWQSYRIASPDGKHMVFGYAERGTVLNSRLRPPGDDKEALLTLALGFSENATAGNQVIISKFIAEGWVVENEEAP